MKSKRWILSSYTLEDNTNNNEYHTGVSLADCTIPFEKLLNTYEDELLFYREKYRLFRKESKEYKKKFDNLNKFLKEEFDLDYDLLIEEGVL